MLFRSLLDDWIDDLGHLTEPQFLAACAEHRRNSDFFPGTKSILDAHACVIARDDHRPKLLALSQHGSTLSEEQVGINQRGCAKVLDIVRRASANKKVSAA